jgi:hypothetical protein
MRARTGGNDSVTDDLVTGNPVRQQPQPPPPPPPPPPPSDRITVALIPQSAEDLQTLQDRTSLSKTDLVNRAITLYEFIDAQLREGHDLIVRDKKTGETQLVRFL